jgi:4-hydroxy-tetrahydrodipicolinate synthase
MSGPRGTGIGNGGVYLPIVTPFGQDGEVDLQSLEGLAHHVIDAGIAGIVALGTTGEPATLRPDERRAVVEACARVTSDREVALIVGPGTNNTAATIADITSLAEIGDVDAVLCVVPYYTRPGQAGVLAHYEAVARASPLPVVAYNIPYRTGQPLELSTLLALASDPNIIGVKQSVPMDRTALRLLAEAPADFAVLCGEDAYLFPATVLGGAGAIAASAHVCTKQIVEMVAAAYASDVETGRARHNSLLPVIEACFAEPSPSVIKAVLHAQGLISSPAVRLPLVPASPVSLEAAMAAIDRVGG